MLGRAARVNYVLLHSRKSVRLWRAQRFLTGQKFMTPNLKNQRLWAEVFSPDEIFDPELGSWSTLQKFVFPLLFESASAAHCEGVRRLGLDDPTMPSFNQFQDRVLVETGWELIKSAAEMPARDYFALLALRKFPCVESIRPTHEVFCGSKPDFWHESVGHISALVDTSASDFYQWAGKTVTQAHANGDTQLAARLEQMLWVLLEYGFLEENGQPKCFGAALTGSYMAQMRWKHGVISATSNWTGHDILSSRLYEEGARLPRDERGRITFFCMPSLIEARSRIERFVEE
jgi:phenylalanine-4-hydroxylase